MGRPALPIGSHGKIRVHEVSPGVFRAFAKVRDHDGVTRPVNRSAKSSSAAERALKKAITDRIGKIPGDISADTRLRVVAELWFEEFERLVAADKRSPTTARLYRGCLDNHIIPGVGALTIRETTVPRCHRFIIGKDEAEGHSVAKLCRAVLSGVCGYCCQHGALDVNPVREIGEIGDTSNPAVALMLDQARELRGRIARHPKARKWDLVDFTDMMLATGLRIGEASAVLPEAVDLGEGLVEVRGTVIRETGKGLRIKPKPKSKAGYRTLELPGWMVESLRRRLAVWDPAEPVFPAPEGGLRDPSNTQADLRKIFADCGYDWVTSHVYRKTVATLMDEAGLSARDAADQLGHAKVSMTQDHYFGRRRRSTGAAAVLSVVADVS